MSSRVEFLKLVYNVSLEKGIANEFPVMLMLAVHRALE
jgi:hypothetical protein